MVAPAAQYSVLKVLVQAPTPYTKHLFLKPHAAADSLPAGRALFVAGIPLSLSAEDVVELFSAFGDLETSALHPSRTTGIVIYEEEADCNKVLAAARRGTALELTPAEPEGPVGLKSWVEAHKARFPGNAELQQQLDDWVEEFEAAEERKRKAAGAAEDDGWTVVKRHKGRHKTTDGEGLAMGGVAAAVAAEAGAKAALAVKTAPDFYRFQQRERRRDELFDLRERFEADKRKIAELKAARRFKPL